MLCSIYRCFACARSLQSFLDNPPCSRETHLFAVLPYIAKRSEKKNTGCCSNFYSRCRNTKKMNVDLDVPSVPVRSTYISKKFKESTQELVREIKTHPNEGKKRKKHTNTHTQSASQDLIQMNIREKRMKKVQWQWSA